MTVGIQFHFPTTNWRKVKTGGLLLALSLILIVWLGPLWSIAVSTIGLAVSFAIFIESLRRSNSPPAWIGICLGLAHTLLLGCAAFLYFLFQYPAVSLAVPGLTKSVSALSGQLSFKVPANWKTSAFMTGTDYGIALRPGPGAAYVGLQEVKISLKKMERSSEKKSIPLQGEMFDSGAYQAVLNVFTVRKFWLRYHQVTAVGFKNEQTLCSVSTAVLPPYLALAKELCKALFKNVQVQATLRK